MFLKNRNIISKIRRSKVTDYAALKDLNFRIFELSPMIKINGHLLKMTHYVRDPGPSCLDK